MNHVDILYDHYKDSVSLMKSAQRERDRFFVVVCILLALLFVFSLDPQNTISTLQQIAKEQWGVTYIPETSILRSLLWGLLLYYTVQYIQRNIYSERTTNYIHKLEQELQTHAALSISREGQDYLNAYPKVLDLICFIYTIAFPVLYLVLIAFEFNYERQTTHSLLNSILAILDFILICLYILFLHGDKISTHFIGLFQSRAR